VNWAFVGASTIAGLYLTGAVRAMRSCEIRWIVGSFADRAASFAKTHGISHSGTDRSIAMADSAVGTVYIPSTDEKHHAQTLAVSHGQSQ
jgi:1,5-anhydro-D-fructose reductase (1,5-anhydro-D-mannitol-forming)